MGFDPSQQLSQHVVRILGATSSQSDSIDLLRKTRLLLERDRSRAQYPMLSLYCDWVQHAEIDRNSEAWTVLEMVDRAVVDHGSTEEGMKAVFRAISDAFGLPALRQEFIHLFQAKAISTDIFESFSNWRRFLLLLLDDLSHRPLSLPAAVESDKKTKPYAVFERMTRYRQASGRRPDMLTRRLYVTNRSNEPGEPGRPPGIYWHLQSALDSGGVYRAELNGMFELSEQPSDFRGP
jgi:hypothetical protein